MLDEKITELNYGTKIPPWIKIGRDYALHCQDNLIRLDEDPGGYRFSRH
jgi:hypothetical protein